jgi:hypothetical protein
LCLICELQIENCCIAIPSVRLYHCACDESAAKTFSPLEQWLPEHVSPELQYIETKWASLMSYGLTSQLLQDVLPLNATQNAATVRNHLHRVAQRQEDELVDKPECISGCPRDWGNLPKINQDFQFLCDHQILQV